MVNYRSNKVRMHAASSGSATVALRVPTFTSRGLYKRIDDVLGRDITGTVYSLKGCPSLAVKEIPLNGLDRGSVDNIKAKLTVIIALSYPGVLKYYQVIEHKGLIYIVTDRHDKTLEGLLIEHRRRKSPVSVAVTLSIVRQVAAALAYLHSASGVDANGLVHRDLRPANILISADGEYFVITGLGLSRDALWSESTFAGTAAYRAPEALLRSEASPASDMWGLGVIVYELATLRRPNFLEGREPREVFVDGWRPELSGVADDLIKGILERIFVLEPEKRLTARELHKMLTVPDIQVSELGAQYVKLKDECHSLETVLNSANARIALLEDELRAKADRIIALRQTTREGQGQPMTSRQARQRRRPRTGAQSQARRIGALEDQAKGLESTLGQVGDGVSTAGPQQAPLAA